jgi:splicing factor 4
VKSVTVIRNDDSESTNSDTETWNTIKERNLKNLKRKAIHSRSRKQQDVSTTDSSDDNDLNHKDSPRYYERKYKMSSAASSSSSNSKPSGDLEHQSQQQQQQDQSNVQSSESSSRPPKRKKSRWSEAPKVQTAVVPPPVTSASVVPQTATVAATVVEVKPALLSTFTRSDPALQNYARQNFGTTNLSEEDWKKAEEHYKINLLFQDMQRKRQEIEQLAKKGKFKFEYDSDEDCNGGTWEHKLRSQEMEATLKWAEALNQQCHGKHHIGDFLPPGE